MNKMDTGKADTQPLSDQELAQLEREMETGEPVSSSESLSSLQREHLDAYARINELAAPIRSAIAAVDAPPSLRDYEALTEIGRGGMGVVYRALHRKTQRQDAIKVIRHDRLAGMSSETVKLMQLRFQQESKLAARVAHEHIVPIYQVGEIDERPWFSMQLVDGASLREITCDREIAPERVAGYIEAIARAIDVVHRHGIIHGDIKPQNILIEHETERPLISDFGLADFEGTFSTDAVSGVAGTPAYIAPEIASAAIQGKLPDEIAAVRSVASDVYSLGATLWAALSGSSPCSEHRTPRQQLNDVASRNLRLEMIGSRTIPPALSRIALKCLEQEPSARYSTAAELADELAAWLERPRLHRHFPSLRNLLWMVVAPVLLINGIVVWWLLQVGASEGWIWLTIFSGYGPLFATFLASHRMDRTALQARRELWSIWIGHFVSTFVCLVAMRILCHPGFDKTLEFSYPCWACISSLVFFAKSGNFWPAYRWIGAFWAAAAVLLTIMPSPSILYGAFAALTCVVIAKGDRSFLDQ